MIDIATVAVIALPSAAMGAFLAHTFLPAKGEGSPNVCGDATAKLTDQLIWWQEVAHNLDERNKTTELDLALARKRLSDAGLQSAGGEA